MNGRLIVIEGLDGAGKSTQVKLLREYLAQREIKHEFLHFPRTDNPIGEMISRYLRGELGQIDEISPYFAALMYSCDRSDFLPTLNEWLCKNDVVLLDRYYHSNIAYNCAKVKDAHQKAALEQWIIDLEIVHNKLPKPDLTLFVDMDMRFIEGNLAAGRSGCDRTYLGGKSDIHEQSLSFQAAVRDEYLRLADADPAFKVIEIKKGLSPNEISDILISNLLDRGVI